jgi:hypothetical protein
MILSLGACKKNEAVKAPPPPVAGQAPASVPTAPVTPPAVKIPGRSAEQRAAQLGFVQYLPQDTEVVMSFHQGLKAVDRVKSSQFWKLLQSELGLGGTSTGEGAATEPTRIGRLLGTEFTLAMGKTAGTQAAQVLTAYRRMGYFQMRLLAKTFAGACQSGDVAAMKQVGAQPYSAELLKELLADPESGITLVERLKMPPLYLAFRTPAAQREAASQQLAALVANLGMLGEVVESVSIEKAGQKFTGHKVSGAKIAEVLAMDREQMDQLLEPAKIDQLFAAIAKKDLVVVSGSLGEYSILFVGSSIEDLNLAATPAQSLVASDCLAFSDAYATKELTAVMYGQKSAIDALQAAAGGLSDMAIGLRDGLAGAEGLGDTRNLETLLRTVGERESALRKLITNESIGIAAFFEDGFKIESYGGSDNGGVDWKASNKLASLGDSEGVVMFANMTTEAAYDEKARAYMEVLMETAYAMAMKVAECKVQDAKIAQFKQMAMLFDSQFRPDAVAMWDAFSGDFGGGLGRERACIMDLSGSVPALPGIPQAVVDSGKFPRISIVAPVADRAKLAASWQKINASATSVLGKISEMAEQTIPMQKPISSEKDGFTTWFFSLPFFNDDFMPSVTVGDKWFAASTSKKQALDLVQMAAKGSESQTGLSFRLNFKALQKFSRETLKSVDQNSAAIFSNGAVPTDEMAKAARIIEAMKDLDQFTVHVRREGGALRSSIHFKTR